MSDDIQSKERIRTAIKLIKQQRYDAARDILNTVDHPGAQELLQRIDGLSSRRRSSPISAGMALFGVLMGVALISLFLILRYLPDFVEAVRPPEQRMDDTFLGVDEILYADLAGFCYHVTGYGGELCLDWTEFVIREHRTAIEICHDPYQGSVILTVEQYAAFGNCLYEASVPPPL